MNRLTALIAALFADADDLLELREQSVLDAAHIDRLTDQLNQARHEAAATAKENTDLRRRLAEARHPSRHQPGDLAAGIREASAREQLELMRVQNDDLANRLIEAHRRIADLEARTVAS